MNRKWKNILTVSLIPLLLLSACKKPEDSGNTPAEETELPTDIVPQLIAYPIEHEPEFGGVYITMSIEDFNALGFEFGDSVDVSFSNGYTLEDLPYYNGYYVDAGEPLLIGYPGYTYIKAAVNYGDDLFVTAGLRESDLANITLRQRNKYRDVQNARNISYRDIREEFDSDEIFANFRAMNLGSLRQNILYRSASPCDNSHNRAPYVDSLIKEAGVKTIFDLADTDQKIQNYMMDESFDSPYFQSLYENGNVLPIGLNMNYLADDFAQKIAKGFTDLSKKDGPYLINCTEGKDRTGFICMLVEMLAGASYQDIIDDYMISYDNYYQITEEKDPDRYQVIRDKSFLPMMRYVAGEGKDPAKTNLAKAAEDYLLKGGMSKEDLEAFKAKIMN